MVYNPMAGKQTIAGTYTGDGSNDRQITTGFKCGMVILFDSETGMEYTWIVLPTYTLQRGNTGTGAITTDALLHASDGFVVDNALANRSTEVYQYWAIEA